MISHSALGPVGGHRLPVVVADLDVVRMGGSHSAAGGGRDSGHPHRPWSTVSMLTWATALIVAVLIVLVGVQLQLAAAPQVIAPGPVSGGQGWVATESASSVALSGLGPA